MFNSAFFRTEGANFIDQILYHILGSSIWRPRRARITLVSHFRKTRTSVVMAGARGGGTTGSKRLYYNRAMISVVKSPVPLVVRYITQLQPPRHGLRQPLDKYLITNSAGPLMKTHRPIVATVSPLFLRRY